MSDYRETFLNLIISIILTEAVTEVLVKAEITKPIRAWLFKHKKTKVFNFLHELLDCGYCTSVWIGSAASILFIDTILINECISWFIFGLIIHRMSNLWHFVIDRVRGLDKIS